MEQEKKPLGFDWDEVVEEMEEDRLTFLEIQADAANNQVGRLRELKNKGNKITDKDVRAAERVADYWFRALARECELAGIVASEELVTEVLSDKRLSGDDGNSYPQRFFDT